MAKNVVDVVRLTSACVDLAERAGKTIFFFLFSFFYSSLFFFFSRLTPSHSR